MVLFVENKISFHFVTFPLVLIVFYVARPCRGDLSLIGKLALRFSELQRSAERTEGQMPHRGTSASLEACRSV